MSKILRTLYIGLERFCARFTNRLITVSGPTLQKGLAYRIGQEDKFTLIYNGIHFFGEDLRPDATQLDRAN